jgi:hypothetical protein
MNATNKPVKTNSKEFLAHVNAYILECINNEEFNVVCNTDGEKLQFLKDQFKNYLTHHELRKFGTYQNALAEWFAGLPSAFNIDCYNGPIFDLAHKWGSLPDRNDEKQKEKISANWFNLIAAKTMQLMEKHNIYLWN